MAWSTRTARAGVPDWDAIGFRSLNSLPDAFAPVAWLPMQAGALFAPLATGAVIAARGDRRSGLRIAVTGAIAWAGAKGLKRLVARGRPGEHDETTVLRVGSADHGLGYPSGHAAVAATIAVGLPATVSARTRVGVAVLAAAVGASRIYVGAHYPLDVIGGWALGTLIGDMYERGERMVVSDGSS